MKQDKQSFCKSISRGEKDWAQPIISYMEYLVLVHMNFSLNTDNFVLPYAKFICHVLLQGMFDATSMVIYHTVTVEKSKKKILFTQFHVFPCN